MTAKSKVLYITGAKGVIDETKQSLIGVVGSTGVIDRQGESVNPMGWQVDNFVKNPVIMYGHNYSSLPIGKADRVYIEGGKLLFDITFADTEMGKEVFNLFKGGFLSAFSVGFIPKKWGVSGVDTFDIMEQELLELSAVPVPANPEALSYLKSNAPVFSKSFLKEEEAPAAPVETPVVEVPPVETPVEELPAEPVVEEKAGRVLSKANEELLRNVYASVGALLEQLDKGKSEEEPVAEIPSIETPAEVVPPVETVETTEEKPADENLPEKNNEETSKLLTEIANGYKKPNVNDIDFLLKDFKCQLGKEIPDIK